MPGSGPGSWNKVAPMALERRMEMQDDQAARGTGLGARSQGPGEKVGEKTKAGFCSSCLRAWGVLVPESGADGGY